MTHAPSIHRHLTGRLEVVIPVDWSEPDAGRWIRPWLKDVCGARTRSDWDRGKRRWMVPRSHLAVLRDALVERFGLCAVFADNQISATVQCDTRCIEARGDECVCACGGLNHRGGEAGYLQVGETTLVAQTSEYWTTRRVYRRDHPR